MARRNAVGRQASRNPITHLKRHVVPQIRQIAHHAIDQSMDVDLPRLFLGHVLADEREGLLGHALHLVQAGNDLFARVLIVYELRLQTQTGDRRPQIMGNRGEHSRAITNKAIEPFPHLVEGTDGMAGFKRARFLKILNFLAPPKLIGCRREPAHGA